jgi:hypothetical protein
MGIPLVAGCSEAHICFAISICLRFLMICESGGFLLPASEGRSRFAIKERSPNATRIENKKPGRTSGRGRSDLSGGFILFWIHGP